MSNQAFYRLAPFIQEYIFRQGWTELRDVQTEAAHVIFETDNHLLLATGTASGKTEAAFLPILTLLLERDLPGIGALYIGPTKALINDQFVRLQSLLDEVDMPVAHWHGDVSRGHKQRTIKNPRGILQITPESLESLLINRQLELPSLFANLRFIVIDEVHVFMGSERGQQILCQLARLSRYISSEPRRIGLSATLGDYSLAEQWLGSGSSRPVITPDLPRSTGQKLRLSLEHFVRNEEATVDAYSHYLFKVTAGRKALIFANNRGETEQVIAALRQIAHEQRLPDIYHVHHGSISAALREDAEEAMRDPYAPAVTAATVTLELGIDLGQLETVVQLNAPHSVSSFLQRLGRSGRRGQAQEMRLVVTERGADDLLPIDLPWQLLQSIAVLQLYLEERFIEPIKPPVLPISLLYHQTMSLLLATGGLVPAKLAQSVLKLPPFCQVTQADYRQLLLHLLEIDHLEKMDSGELIVGLTGERIARNFRFFAVFSDTDEYAVLADGKEIGTINSLPDIGERIALAGRSWEIIEIDGHRKQVVVKPVPGRAEVSWTGSGVNIHTRIMQKMRQVLVEDTEYRYLQLGATARLQQARYQVRQAGVVSHPVTALAPNTFLIMPWLGSAAFRTLERLIRQLGKEGIEIRLLTSVAPYYLLVHSQLGSRQKLISTLQRAIKHLYSASLLLGSQERPQLRKFDEFVPPELLRKAYAADHLDLSELQAQLARW